MSARCIIIATHVAESENKPSVLRQVIQRINWNMGNAYIMLIIDLIHLFKNSTLKKFQYLGKFLWT
jgi:hypothetical protein